MAERPKLDMILVMGVTGAGKSYFCNSIAGMEKTPEGHGLEACTTDCKAVTISVGGTKVMLVDTPGFDDPKKSNSDVLTKISTVLAAQYQLGVNLKGVIYLYRISDVRHSGGASKTLNIFTRICGEAALKNVILTTTRWDKVTETEGARHEADLRQNFWKYMLLKEATMDRYYGDRDSGLAIIGRLVGKSNVVLDLQKEMVDERKALKDTTAGSYLHDDVSALKAEYEKELAELEKLRRGLADADARMRDEIMADVREEQSKLDRANADQEILRKMIAEEVRADIQEEVQLSRKKNGRSSVPALVSTAVGVLNLFLNLDPTAKSQLTQWFSAFSLSDFFGNFFSGFGS